MASSDAARKSWRTPYLLVALPALFLLAFFVVPNLVLFSASVLKSDGMVPTGELTLDNFQLLLTRKLYVDAILRTFGIGLSVGALVVVVAYPIAWVLVRTNSRWKNTLIALALAPLLASVIVRTYGWWVIFNNDGAINGFLLQLGLIAHPLVMLPSNAVIIIGLTHALLPYGVLTLMAALGGVNPNLERAAMSLGAGRVRTFLTVTLPLTGSGVAGGFLLAFAVAISAYATPAILGGPANRTMATLIYNFMTTLLDWSSGSAMGVILLASSLALVWLTTLFGRGRRRAQP
jgi:putative spermidine/putrescine transport system permease protein